MIKVVKIHRTFLNRLFVLMIVELISAGFFLFYKQFNPTEPVFDPPLPMEVYLFDNKGDPIEETKLVLDKEVIRAFPKINDDVLKDVSRKAELNPEDDELRFQSGDNTYLGSLKNASSVLGDSFLPFEQTFQLGMRYAECQAPGENPCNKRLNGRQAIGYLLRAVGADKDTDEMEVAVKQLFFLLGDLRRCEEFQNLVKGIKKFRKPPQQHHELAETYLTFSQRADASTNEKLVAQKGALKHYLAYLGEMGHLEPNDLIGPSQKRASGLLEIIVNTIGEEDTYLQTNSSGISTAIDSLETQSLISYSNAIEFDFSCSN